MADPAHGVVLAGGAARRMGGAKATALFRGAPLLDAPVRALREAGLPVAVVAKPDTVLPPLDDVRVLREPAEPVHPLAGIVHALAVLDRPVVVVAGDMPFVAPGLLAELAALDAAVAVVATSSPQPLLARYTPGVRDALADAVAQGASARSVLESLGARVVVIGPERLARYGDPDLIVADIDTPQDLRAAEGRPD